MNEQRVVVTGGGGFIGKATCEWLRRAGYDPVTFDRPERDVRNCAHINDALAGSYAVVHLAGLLGTHELFDEIDKAIDVNVRGTANVLQACKSHGVKYVGITMPQVFPSVYTATKMAATRLASAFHQAYGLKVSHVRAFNAFGPGQKYGPGHPQKILPTFAIKVWRNEPVPVWGDGQQTVDLIHVSDLGRMLADAVRLGGEDEVFDGGTGQPFSVLEVVGMVGRAAGLAPQVMTLPMRRGETPTFLVAAGDGWSQLKWRPTFDMQQFKEAVEWYRPYAEHNRPVD